MLARSTRLARGLCLATIASRLILSAEQVCHGGACRESSSSSSVPKVRSTAASGSSVYESTRAVDEYLLFHYGDDADMMPYAFGPKQALQFPSRLAEFSLTHAGAARGRALDLGCSVGGSAFQLAKHYEQVVGIDFSQHFVDAASNMASKGSADYEILKQGQVFLKRTAKVPASIDRSRVSFQQGDACNLNAATLGTFDLILASNLLCRLPDPKKFLLDISRFLAPGGTLVLVSPYSWLEEYTPVKEWFGAKMSEEDPLKAIDSFEAVKDFIAQNRLPLVMTHKEDIPFLIREHERKFQYGVSDCTVWKKTA